MLRVLVACEFSGIVRNAFARRGFDAWSCDLLPSETEGNHLQCDVRDVLNDNWNLIIAHPPCTYLTVSANKYYDVKRYGEKAIERQKKRKEAIEFFMGLILAPCYHIAIENPVGIMSTVFEKPNQIIQPWMFGHPESKATCLWLIGLPKLKPTIIVKCKEYRCRCGQIYTAELNKYPRCKTPSNQALPKWNNQTPGGHNNLPLSKERWKIRSRIYPGIAEAMAEQWGSFLKTQLF